MPAWRRTPAAAAAFAWSLLFALVSFYWAAGGEVGVDTIAADPSALGWGAEPAGLAVVGMLKLLGCLLAAGLVHWGWSRLVRAGGWVAGAALLLYGLASGVDHLAMVTGLRETPVALGEAAARWHLVLWDPFWIVGGVLFLLAARTAATPGADRAASARPERSS